MAPKSSGNEAWQRFSSAPHFHPYGSGPSVQPSPSSTFTSNIAIRASNSSQELPTKSRDYDIVNLVSDDDEENVNQRKEPSIERCKFRKINEDYGSKADDTERSFSENSPAPVSNSRTLVPIVAVSSQTLSGPNVVTKRGRGRPRIRKPTPPKRPRGRPRKESSVPAWTSQPQRTQAPKPLSNWRVNIEDSKIWMRKNLSSPFVQQLIKLNGPSLTVINTVDFETPPSSFSFISEYVFRNGTHRIDKEARTGCMCRPQNGRDVGCEYTSCECLDEAGDENDKLGFPYHAIGEKQGCLRNLYLSTRHMIYECNELCRCPPYCKNKVVQKGRQIPLDIFKTQNRGWGLRCPETIRKGQFVDVYLGEVITDAEARRREKSSTIQKNSYLFALDKFQQSNYSTSVESDSDSLLADSENDEEPPDPNLFVVDGEHMGGPTRFINHSCDPNLRIFTVSLYRGDSRVYELAFFAINEIPAGTELTFDYKDFEEDGHNGFQGKVKCLCESSGCRGWLWI